MAQDGSFPKKEEETDACLVQDFDEFMAEMESDTVFFPHKRKRSGSSVSRRDSEKKIHISDNPDSEIELDDVKIQFPTLDPPSMPSSSTSPTLSPFENIEQSETSISTHELEETAVKIESVDFVQPASPNLETVATLKRSMAGTSRLIGTFTALKSTYLKLCTEFNYLLGKFNENERIKIELIHENNELRKLLWETIKEKELDRKKYKETLLAREKSAKTSDIA